MTNVYDEVAQSDLLPQLAMLSWIEVRISPANHLQTLRQDNHFERLGAGEQELIALALQEQGAVILSNDNQARRLARELGINAVNIPAFLLACKTGGMLTANGAANHRGTLAEGSLCIPSRCADTTALRVASATSTLY